MIILDFGSGETSKNDVSYIHRMINKLAAVDTMRQRIIIKWQLFTSVPSGVPPLKHEVFREADWYAYIKGYQTTASVFDETSLDFLLSEMVDPPFIKIAARPHLYHLIEDIPVGIPVFVSVPDMQTREMVLEEYPGHKITILHCIPEYPANPVVYETMYGQNLSYSISDHSPDLGLFHKWQPWFYERHYKLPDSTGLDAGPFASTPEQLGCIL